MDPLHNGPEPGAAIELARPNPDASAAVVWNEADFHLSEQTARAIADGVPPNTAKAYTRQWAVFDAWCRDSGRTPLPATPHTLAEYTGHLCAADYAPASIEQAIAAVQTRHRISGYKGQPDTEAAGHVLASHRLDRGRRGLRPVQARVLTRGDVRLMLETCDIETTEGLRDAVVISLGVKIMARQSMLSELDIVDLEFVPDYGLIVHVLRSKTDQDAKGREVTIPRGGDPRTDPTVLARTWIGRLESDYQITEGPLLRACGRGGKIQHAGRLSENTVTRIMRRRAKAADVEGWEQVSGHTLRATGATLAALAGMPAGLIAEHGGWSPTSPTVHQYIRAARRFEVNAMKGVDF
jgi:integrase